MRKPDIEVKEVVCSETGKPMPKIPLWMSDVKVKFVSDEARQKHPPLPGIADIEPSRFRSARPSHGDDGADDPHGGATGSDASEDQEVDLGEDTGAGEPGEEHSEGAVAGEDGEP